MKLNRCVRSFCALVILLGISLTLSQSSSAWAFGGAKPPSVPAPDLAPQGPSPQFLEEIFKQSTQELEAVDGLISQKQYGQAMLAAKKIVDRVSIVNPKANYSQHIKVSGVLFTPNFKMTFSGLNNRQKEAIAKAVGDAKGGFFLDLLNLWKRSKLAYLKAFYNQMKGQLMAEDLKKIEDDLSDVHSIAILVEDEKLDQTFMLFDSDVANDDQQYFFDRELVAFGISVQDLRLDESGLRNRLEEKKKLKLKEHWDGIVLPAPPEAATWEVSVCMYEAHDVGPFHYDDALRLCGGDFSKEEASNFIGCVTRAVNSMYYADALRACNGSI